MRSSANCRKNKAAAAGPAATGRRWYGLVTREGTALKRTLAKAPLIAPYVLATSSLRRPPWAEAGDCGLSS